MDKLDTKLVDIDFGSMNNRLQKWFEKLNIVTVKDLVEYGINDLLKIDGFGRLSHTSIWCTLGDLDIHYTDEYERTSYDVPYKDKSINYISIDMDLSTPKDIQNGRYNSLEMKVNLHSNIKSVSSFCLFYYNDGEEIKICEYKDIKQLERLHIFLDSIFKMDKIK